MYKSVRMNPQDLSTMFIGFQRKLFTPPTETDMYSVSEGNGDCTIYFREEFRQNFLAELQLADDAGKFASSNAGDRWLKLISLIYSAQTNELPDNCNDYYLGLQRFL